MLRQVLGLQKPPSAQPYLDCVFVSGSAVTVRRLDLAIGMRRAAASSSPPGNR
jgi:hypothetical protein